MAGLVVLPVLVLVVALAQRTWYPTGDQAQAELRMLSLPGDVPLVGAAGRIIADDGTQGNHPGPLMFWATWPLYRLLGGSSWAFEAATALVNGAGLVASVALVARRIGRGTTLWYGAVTLVLVGGYGLDVLSQPWNPWVALVPFTLLVLATWSVLDGARWPLVLGVAAASYALQGHVGYAPLVPPLVLMGAVALVVRERPRGRADLGPALRRLAPLPVAVVVGLALWSGPIVDLVRHDPSNVDILLEHFGDPDEEVIGVGNGVEAVLQASNPVGPWVAASTGVRGSILPGLVFVVAWAAVAVAVAVRRLDVTLTRLNAVVGLALVVGTVAVSRVFGALFLYTFRWIVALVALEVFTLGWGLVVLVRARRASSPVVVPSGLRVAALGAVAVLSVATAVRVSSQEIPYENSWRTEAELSRQTVAAVGDGTYLVRWEDPVYLGGLAFGLVLGLEREGITAGVDPTYRAAVEPHRVMCPGDYDGVLTVVTGLGGIEAWRSQPRSREVAYADIRTPAERAAGDRDREQLAAALAVADPAEVDGLLSTIVLDPRQPAEVVDIAGRIVDAGVPSAVFETTPDPADAPTGC
ncbi:MAG TPA: hypothetical protein VK507_22835 [Iamia sp.]|nr:hypothetical protein [Iamia sp.]